MDQSSPNFFLLNVEVIVVDNAIFRLSIAKETFATEVYSCPKLCALLILGG